MKRLNTLVVTGLLCFLVGRSAHAQPPLRDSGWGPPPAPVVPADTAAPSQTPATASAASPASVAPTPSAPVAPAPTPRSGSSSSSVKITYETDTDAARSSPVSRPSYSNTGFSNSSAGANPDRAVNAERTNPDEPKRDPLTDSHFLHGFRLGYSFVANYDKPLPGLDGKSFREGAKVRSPHNFLIGYELLVRMMGHSWLNVILLSNVIIGGLEQSKVLPSGNAMIGFEFNNSFQLGIGAHLTPLKGQEAHVVVAGGWTPRVGNFYIPVHMFFVPDVDGNHRTGMLTGVTW